MKKVFALLLVLTMVCSFLPMMASAAANVNLDFSIATYHADEDCDIWEENGVFGVVVTAKGAKFSSGSISIAYDPELVEPSRASGGSCSQTNFTKRVFDTLMVEGSVGELSGTSFWDEDKGYLLFNVIKTTSVDFSEMDGDDVLFSLVFAPVDDSAELKDLEGAFSVIPADDQFLVDCQVKTNGGAGVFKDNTSTVYSTDAGTLGMTGLIVVNQEPDEELEWDAFEGQTDGWDNGFKFIDKETQQETSEYTGKKYVAFGKNGTNGVLESASYGVVIGENTYLGKGEVPVGGVFAIVIVDPEGKVGAATGYKYSIVYKGETKASDLPVVVE